MVMLKKVWDWLYPVPASLMTLGRARKSKLSNLYVLQVNYQVSPEQAKKLSDAFEPYSKKYGLDFLVLEPGQQLKRFEDI